LILLLIPEKLENLLTITGKPRILLKREGERIRVSPSEQSSCPTDTFRRSSGRILE
jgi:hypothetical protein